MPSLLQLMDLKGKGAIVTGGGMGIGQGIALRLAEAGASVLIADIDIEAARQTVDQITKNGGIGHAIQAEAGSVSDAERVAQTAVNNFGRLDILVNNAGIYPPSPVMELSEALWDKVLDINLKGLFFYAQAAARKMIRVAKSSISPRPEQLSQPGTWPIMKPPREASSRLPGPLPKNWARIRSW